MSKKSWMIMFGLAATLALGFALTACGVEDPAPGPAPCTGDECNPDPDPDPAPNPAVCGNTKCETGETVDNCAVDCKAPEPTPATLACPFRSEAPWIWDFAGKYASSATLGEAKFFTAAADGTYPNPKLADTNKDGYLGMEYKTSAGVYRLSYIGYQYADECQDDDCPEAWAQYGSLETLKQLSPECRAYIQCNWWDSAGQKMLDVGCAECSLQVEVKADGQIVGAGNMANLK